MAQMRALVLLCDPEMEPAMLDFVEDYTEVLVLFRLTVPHVLKAAIEDILGPDARFTDLDLTSGLEGAASQCATQMVLEDVGAVIDFNDPFHVAADEPDCQALLRLINVCNILHATNPTSAGALMEVLATAARGDPKLMPSFFKTLESPAVAKYKAEQAAVVAALKARAASVDGKSESAPAIPALITAPAGVEHHDHHDDHNFAQGTHEIAANASGRAPRQFQSMARLKIKRQSNSAPESLAQKRRSEVNMRAMQMRCLALISHNNMKAAMQDFVRENADILRQFRLTGTASTMKMLRSVLGDDCCWGPTCSSGPLGGDAQVGAQMALHDLGAVFFFTDPLSAHPHMADVLSLIRMVNVNNVLHATNPTSAQAFVGVLQKGLAGDDASIPSFFHTLECPALTENTMAGFEAHRKTKRKTFLAQARRATMASARDSTMFKSCRTAHHAGQPRKSKFGLDPALMSQFGSGRKSTIAFPTIPNVSFEDNFVEDDVLRTAEAVEPEKEARPQKARPQEARPQKAQPYRDDFQTVQLALTVGMAVVIGYLLARK